MMAITIHDGNYDLFAQIWNGLSASARLELAHEFLHLHHLQKNTICIEDRPLVGDVTWSLETEVKRGTLNTVICLYCWI